MRALTTNSLLQNGFTLIVFSPIGICQIYFIVIYIFTLIHAQKVENRTENESL